VPLVRPVTVSGLAAPEAFKLLLPAVQVVV
jgi:hypothetical protein